MEAKDFLNSKSSNKRDTFFDVENSNGLMFDVVSSRMGRSFTTYTPTLSVYKDLSFGSLNEYTYSNQPEKFTNLSDALDEYNKGVIEQGGKAIKNVPLESPDMEMGNIREGGIGYKKDNLKSCTILSYSQVRDNPELWTALIYADGGFGIAENVPSKNGKIDLTLVYCPDVGNKDLRTALEKYIDISKQPTKSIASQEHENVEFSAGDIGKSLGDVTRRDVEALKAEIAGVARDEIKDDDKNMDPSNKYER